MKLPSKEQIARKFGKDPLLDICHELGMNVDPATHIWDVAQAIVDDLNENGVPLDDPVSDDLFEFMVFAKFITEDGELIEVVEDDAPEVEEQPVDAAEMEDVPECYGWGMPTYDLSCSRCPLVDDCVVVRDRTLETMPCFGVLCDVDDPDCKDCSIWLLCRDKMEGK